MKPPEFKIILRKKKSIKPLVLTSTYDAAMFCRQCFDKGKIEWIEEVVVLAVDSSLNVLGFYKISSGGMSHAIVDIRVVLQFALLSAANSIIVAHNHPSGSTKPSAADKATHNKLKAACTLMDIKLLDSMIITKTGFYSMESTTIRRKVIN